MRQLGEGGKELAVGAGAEAVGAAGAVDAGVRDGDWAVVAGADTGVGVTAEEAAVAGVDAELELILDPLETSSWACSDGLLGGKADEGIIYFIRQHVLLFFSRVKWEDSVSPLCILK